ncbi:MAG: pitrilysin family protein, partial [Gammaproteobacteria bacterium]|nr:pitrilysin family protein [Gammaproteobacteria bacterium]
AFAVGSQNDPPGKEGLAGLTADLLTQGATRDLSYEQVLERLYPLATDYDATVDKELTTIGGRVHRDKLDDYVELLLAAVTKPAFDNEDFDRLKSDAINWISKTLRYSSDEELGKAALEAAAFARTPYAHPVEGTIAGLESITLDDVKAFYAEHFVTAKLRMGVAGGYAADFPAKLKNALAALPEGQPAAAPEIPTFKPTGRRVVLVDKPKADASISIGFPLGVQRGEREFYALWLANSWLGEHRHGASHLFQVIREKRGLNYGDYSYIEAFPDAGMLQMPPVNVPRRHQLFEVWIRTLPNDQAPFALRAALREIERLISDGLSETQFELTRKFLQKYSTHYAPTTYARLGYAIDDDFYGIDGEGHLARFRAIMGELTLADVNTAIKKHWQIDDLIIAIVTGAGDRLAERLASGEPTPIEYANPMPDAILAEDREIAAYPLNISAEAIERWPVDDVFAS